MSAHVLSSEAYGQSFETMIWWRKTVGVLFLLALLSGRGALGAPIIRDVLLVLEPETQELALARIPGADSLWLARAHERVIRAAQAHAENSQHEILYKLRALALDGKVLNVRSFWVANAIHVRCAAELVPEFESWDGVLEVQPDYPLELVPIHNAERDRAPRGLDENGVSEALISIRAPQAWALGLTGVGVLLANFDSGVNGVHPALSPRWRGNNGEPAAECWFDLVEPLTSTPGDNDGHGTQTMGLQCGLVAGDTVGVAWNAQFIAAAVAEGGSTITNALEAFEWILDPDGNPATFDDVPRVLSNSWGFSGGMDVCNNVLFQAMDLAEAAGIAVVWSAGNEGPPSGTIRNPSNRAETSTSGFAVGGWNGTTDSVWVSSSRGPSPCTQDAALRVKPEVVAPAVSVRTTSGSSSFTSSTGTSFSAPLAAGALALMIEANPLLAPDSLLKLLMLTSVDEDLPGLDNNAGYGKIDALLACQAALTGLGWVRGNVQDAFGNPVEADVFLVNHPHRTLTDSAGVFRLGLPAYLPAELQVIASGFVPQTVPIQTWPGDSSYVAIVLAATAQGILTGNVIDCRGFPAEEATVFLPQHPEIPDVFADANGRFVVILNPGTYSVACSSAACNAVTVSGVEIFAGAVTDIEIILPLNPAFLCSEPDPYGYYLCDSNDPGGPPFEYSSVAPEQGGKGVIHNLADDGNVPLALPFPVTYYGQTYSRVFLNSNGIISFVRYLTAYNNVQLPYNQTTALFPFWDDLSDPTGGHLLSDYDPARGTYTLEFFEVPHFVSVPPPTDSANFQVVFFDPEVYPSQTGNSFIEFRYGRLDLNTGATVGIDKGSGNGYVRYGFNNLWETHAVPVMEGLSIRVAEAGFPSGAPSLQVEPAALDFALAAGEILDTSLYVHNLGSAPLAYELVIPQTSVAEEEVHELSTRIFPEEPPKGTPPPRFDRRTATLDDELPDAYGYTWSTSHEDTSIAYEFFDIATIGTNVGIIRDDTITYPRPLPWQFPFYGRVFDQYAVCSNGFISFWSQVRNYLNDPLDYARDPYYAIAPLWLDLNPASSGQILEYYDQAHERFIVQWNEVPKFGGSAGNNFTFQAVLYPNGEIELVYEHMRDVYTLYTTGIKGGGGNAYLELSYNGALIDSLMTIRISRPDTSAASVRVLSGKQGVVPPQGAQEIRLRFTNNFSTQGQLGFPLTFVSSAPDGGSVTLDVNMQAGAPFVPQTVLAWEPTGLRLHWQAHPLDAYSVWSAAPDDSVFTLFVPVVNDTTYAFSIPADVMKIYAVTLSGEPAPSVWPSPNPMSTVSSTTK